jgi:hypothetical protein
MKSLPAPQTHSTNSLVAITMHIKQRKKKQINKQTAHTNQQVINNQHLPSGTAQILVSPAALYEPGSE